MLLAAARTTRIQPEPVNFSIHSQVQSKINDLFCFKGLLSYSRPVPRLGAFLIAFPLAMIKIICSATLANITTSFQCVNQAHCKCKWFVDYKLV